jgi:Holliday junction resolvase-like predicted endonuclease
MAEEIFNPLDSLGPEYGSINSPILDEKGLSAFEGNVPKTPTIEFPKPENYYPTLSGVQNLDRQNVNIRQNLVRTPVNNSSIPKKNLKASEVSAANTAYLDNFFQANQDKNAYGKIYSYNAGPDGNAFYKRYAAYGQKKFDEVGFSPIRDNEANFNSRTTRWDDFSRMMTHSFVPLVTSGFTSGPRSLMAMATGDFTSADLEDARLYEEAAAIGQSSKGGVMGFVNNTVMNFGYTAGIIGEAILEETAGALLAAPTGGASLFATTMNNMRKGKNLARGLDFMSDGYDAVNGSLRAMNNMNQARKVWQTVRESATLGKVGKFINPLENTYDALSGIRKAVKAGDNITDLAILSKTAGGFYRDIRNVNMALSEARLEAGMVENKIYDKLYNDAWIANDHKVPDNKELAAIEKQAKEASLETMMLNTGLIYFSNKITFGNITAPRGGLRNFIKSTTDELYEVAAREGTKDFGKLGKVIYDQTAKAFKFQKNNIAELAKGWAKNPIYKSVGSTVGYFKSNFTEGIQENLQEVIAQANERYYVDAYKSPGLQTNLYSKAVIKQGLQPKKDYYYDGLKDQFSAQGAETFASGLFMGTLAGPLNNAVPFLSSSYNRIFDKEGYNKWKEAQMNITEGLIKQLNDQSLAEHFSDVHFNAGAQDLISKIKNSGSKKDGLDAEMEAYIEGINLMRNTGSTFLFKERLEGLKDATDEEFAEDIGIDVKDADKYRARIDSAIERIDKVNDAYDKAEKLFPSPANPKTLGLDEKSDEYKAKVLSYNAHQTSIKNLVFFNESFKDAMGRRVAIQEKYLSNPDLQKAGYTEGALLFKPANMINEIALAAQELQMEKDGANDPKKIKALESKIEVLSQFSDAHSKFNLFFNRHEFAQKYKEALTKELKREPTAEEIADRMEQDMGSLDDPQMRELFVSNLKEAHNKYIKTLAKDKDEIVFDKDMDEAFVLLMDYYTLVKDGQKLATYIDHLHNPENFYDLVSRNKKWMDHQYNQRVKYYEDLITSEIGKVRDNAFLNKLYDAGYVMSQEDMLDYLGKNSLPPSEIYNHTTKEIYKEGSPEYNKIYEEFFKKRAELKAQVKPKKTGIVKAEYEKQLADLEEQKQAAIDQLPTEEVRVDGESMKKKGKNKTLSMDEVYDQLETEEYVELSYKDMSAPMVFYKDVNGDIRLEGPEGEYVDLEGVKVRFTEAKRFTYEEQRNAADVKKIEDTYKAKRDAILDAYNADMKVIEDESEYEEIDQNTDLNTADLKEFRNMLYEKYTDYVETLDEEEKERLYDDPEAFNQEFEEWTKLPENKQYFDKYNKQNKPVAKEDAVFTFDGEDVDTKDYTLPQLIRFRDNLNNRVTEMEKDELMATPEEIEEGKDIKRGYKTDIKTLNTIIQKRQLAGFSPVIKEGIKKIQKLLEAQKGVEPGYLLTEDDEATGLKAGEKAYRVDGLVHRRTTNAIQDVIEEEYEYKGKQAVEKAFNLTIGKEGLNNKSIDSFMSQMSALLETDSLPGMNQDLLDEVEDELKALNGKSVEQIKNEKAQDKINKQIDKINAEIEKAEEDGNATRVQNLIQQRAELYPKLAELSSKGKGTQPVDTEAEQNAILARFEAEDITQERIDDLMSYDSGNGKILEQAQRLIDNYNRIFDVNAKVTGFNNRKLDIQIGNYKTSISAEALKLAGKSEIFTIDQEGILELIKAKYQAELEALGQAEAPTETINTHTTFDIIMDMISEKSFEDGRIAGNFADLAKDYLESGAKPVFNEKLISQEAYDSLFDESTGFLTKIKRMVDAGEMYLIGRDLVVYDSNIIKSNSSDRIAGEIDLLLATEDGIMIVDIKTGTATKWRNFNKVKRTEEDKVYSKREEYTLQQGAYATMLENMIEAPVTIALLPIERSSNAETDQMVTAGQPSNKAIYNAVEYEKNPDGSYKRNDIGQLVFKQTNDKVYKYFIPLYRDSIQDKLNILFPQGAVKVIPGLKSIAKKQMDSYKTQLDKITAKNTKANVDALDKIEKHMTEFAAKNNVSIPEELTNLIKVKRADLNKEGSMRVINNAMVKYQATKDNSQKEIDNISNRLGKIKNTVSFDDIDLDTYSAFIQEQLEEDAQFKSRFDTHEESFANRRSSPTPGQLAAADILHTSGILSDEEYESIADEGYDSSEVSELIHESVKRIQYLKVNSTTDKQAAELADYQKEIFNLMTNTKWHTANVGTVMILENIKENLDEGNVKTAIDILDLELIRMEKLMNSAYVKNIEKTTLKTKIADFNAIKQAIVDMTAYVEEMFETPVEIEEEGELEEFETFGTELENKYTVGTILYKKNDNFDEYTVDKVNNDGTVVLAAPDGKKTTHRMDTISKDFSTEKEIMGETPEDTSYETNQVEDSHLKESQGTVDEFIITPALKDKAHEEGMKQSISSIEKDLIAQIKNCQ